MDNNMKSEYDEDIKQKELVQKDTNDVIKNISKI